MRALVLALALAGCLHSGEQPGARTKLAQCRSEGVAAYQTAPKGSGDAAANSAYSACKRRLGVTW